MSFDVIGALFIIGPIRNRRRLRKRDLDIIDKIRTNLKEGEENPRSFFIHTNPLIPKFD
ncbi:MAG: hypothetical protein OEL82_00125 [Nitrosopumilus sp.]|nr:hypothetical protein [Nitrosopumilus sp.]